MTKGSKGMAMKDTKKKKPSVASSKVKAGKKVFGYGKY